MDGDDSIVLDSDGFDDDALNAQLDAIEAAYTQTRQTQEVEQPAPAPTATANPTANAQPGPSIARANNVIDLEDDDDDEYLDMSLDLPEEVLSLLDRGIVINDPPPPPMNQTRQTTLFGSTPRTHAPAMYKASVFTKTKVWDHTAFARTGTNKKGKKRGSANDGEQDHTDDLPAPFVPIGQPLPMKPQLDRLDARTWIYPLNREKRRYQFDIARACLLENSLVAIPTGTGKTFIAGVIMLNYYRWFPQGKVIFLAPTKPLVAQQIMACHEVCGIPGNDAAELTGEITPVKRAALWEQKRVFYMTPQTLESDLARENFDIRDVVLVVLDEAHRATGDYAYCKVIRTFMAKNPHFRVLALTATPSSDKEKLQPIVDSLHLSHIEIRSESSPDLKEYIKEKRLIKHIIPTTPEVQPVRDALAKVMKKEIDKCKHGELYSSVDPIRASPYLFKAAQDRLRASRQQGARGGDEWYNSSVYWALTNLQTLARVMSYLMDHSPRLAKEYLDSAFAGSEAKGPPPITKTPAFKELVTEFEKANAAAPLVHPKMEKLRSLLLDYFVAAEDDPERQGSKAMVFANFRNVVEELVDFLGSDAPLVRPTKFVGQSGDAKGRKGQSQKEQLKVIEDFKTNKFNVLISTSVGEEGLDIGEVDLIICYETPQGAIRNLQRAGRTGRKRDGRLELLLTEGREDDNWEKSKAKYEDVQTAIRSAKLELYADVKRLVDGDIKPECVERVMEIQPYERVFAAKRGSGAAAVLEEAGPSNHQGGDEFFSGSEDQPVKPKRASKKRKRDDDPGRNIPIGATSGFVSVADMVQRGSKKRKTADSGELSTAGSSKHESAKKKEPPELTISQVMAEFDDVDAEVEANYDAPPFPPKTSKGKGKTKVVSDKSAKPRASKKDTKSKTPAKSTSHSPKQRPPKTASPVVLDHSIIDLCDSSPAIPRPQPAASTINRVGGSWLLSDDEGEDDEKPAPPKSSPLPGVSIGNPPLASTSRLGVSFAPSPIGFLSARAIPRNEPDLDFDSDVEMKTSTPPPKKGRASSQTAMPPPSGLPSHAFPSPAHMSQESPDSFSQAIRGPGTRRAPIASRVLASPVNSFLASPDTESPAVRKLGARRIRKLAQIEVTDERLSSPQQALSSQIRTEQYRRGASSSSTSPSPPPQPRRKVSRVRADPARRAQRNVLLDTLAVHSGDENSSNAGDTSASDEEESESDRLFVTELSATQADPDYDQDGAYRASLFTQVPSGSRHGLQFGRGPIRTNSHLNTREQEIMRANKRAAGVSSSPPGPDRTLSDYEMDSFIVGDDEEIVYDGSSP